VCHERGVGYPLMPPADDGAGTHAVGDGGRVGQEEEEVGGGGDLSLSKTSTLLCQVHQLGEEETGEHRHPQVCVFVCECVCVPVCVLSCVCVCVFVVLCKLLTCC
jgi:hypothetical protein